MIMLASMIFVCLLFITWNSDVKSHFLRTERITFDRVFFAIDFIMCSKTLKEIQLLKELCKVKLESVFNYKTYIMVELLPSKNLKNT